MMKIFAIIFSCLYLASTIKADTFTVDNSAIQAGLTPYNWYTDGATSITTIYAGAQLSLNFTGTSFAINVDVSTLTGAGIDAAQYPYVAVAVDGGALGANVQLTPSGGTITLATGLADSLHSVNMILMVMYAGSGSNRWGPTNCLRITGIVVDSGKTISAATVPLGGKALFLGDSITESMNAGEVGGWPYLIASYLGAKWGQCGVSGTGWDIGHQLVPKLTDAWNLLVSDTTNRDFSGTTYVFINDGQNGDVDQTSAMTMLTNLRTAIGADPYIYLMVPFSQERVAQLTTLYNSYIAAYPSDHIVFINLGTDGTAIINNPTYTPDGVHPNAAGCALLAALIEPFLIFTPPSATAPGFPNNRNAAVQSAF